MDLNMQKKNPQISPRVYLYLQQLSIGISKQYPPAPHKPDQTHHSYPHHHWQQ